MNTPFMNCELQKKMTAVREVNSSQYDVIFCQFLHFLLPLQRNKLFFGIVFASRRIV